MKEPTMNSWRETIERNVEQFLQNTPLHGLGQNAKTLLTSALQQMDVVTREEYEVQVALLARTREKLDALEVQVQQLVGK